MKKYVVVLLALTYLVTSCEGEDEAVTPTSTNSTQQSNSTPVAEVETQVEMDTAVVVETETSEEEEYSKEEPVAVAASPIIRVSMVNTATNAVSIANLGGGSVDVGNYFLCLGPGTYRQISALTTASTILAATESVTVIYDLINASADGLSVFTTNSFGSTDPEILIDYVQWGAAGQARVNQAVTAGRWNSSEAFLPVADTYTFSGTEAQFGADFYTSN